MNVRAARPDDYEAWLRFWSYLGLDATPPSRERFVAGICPHTSFLEEEGALVAYNLGFAFGARGDVRQIAVSPAFRRRGVGTQLMAAVAAKLRAAGCTEWRLEVRADNTAAIALYHAVGMTKLRDLFTLRITREAATRFAQPGLSELVSSDDDARLEAALDLGAGQVLRWRTFRATAPQVRVGHDAMAQIIRDFAPDHGLLLPFLAPTAGVAKTLMSAAIRDAPAEYELQLPGGPVHAALLEAGARPLEHLYEFAGALT
ncbi:hypothetical protein BH11MYX1_BH11MYX1_57340 [soil metagenome]